MKYLVTDIGGTFTKYAVMDEECQIYEKGKVSTEKGSTEEFLDMLVELFGKYGGEAEGMAISAPGIIDSERGFMHNAGSIWCVEELDIAKVLTERIGVPVTVENDAKCAALAEMWRGSLQGCRNAAVMIIGTGLGGAVFCDGKLVKGSHLFAGEFSYILSNAEDALNPEKILGANGGAPALITLVAEKKGMTKEELDGVKVFEMANGGDPETLEALHMYCRRLAVHILNCQFMVDPEKIAVGGGISVQPLLLTTIREEMEKIYKVFPHEIPAPEVTTCKYFNDSNLIGALYVYLNAHPAQE